MNKKCAKCGKAHSMKTDICDVCGSMSFVPISKGDRPETLNPVETKAMKANDPTPSAPEVPEAPKEKKTFNKPRK